MAGYSELANKETPSDALYIALVKAVLNLSGTVITH
jgi:hypothetical protein